MISIGSPADPPCVLSRNAHPWGASPRAFATITEPPLPACAVRSGDDSCHRLCPPLPFSTCCASATQSRQTRPEMHKLLFRVSSATHQACIKARRILHHPRLRFIGREHHSQSVHWIMQKRNTTVTDATTAGLMSGSSHTDWQQAANSTALRSYSPAAEHSS
jgi:hypothetical protein